VGLTELEIVVPILVKNLLNSSAMEGESEICLPSTTIFSILAQCFVPTVASLRRFQVFLGIFYIRI
jgi:hypothetical protein